MSYSTRLLLLVLLAAMAPLLALARLIIDTPGIILLAALVPPTAYALVLLFLDHREQKPWPLPLGAFLWGAMIASVCSSTLNANASLWLTQLLTEERARSLAPVIAAPIIEEVAKAAGLLFLIGFSSQACRNPRNGIVYGALVGLGFDVAENLNYFTLAAVQGGTVGLARSLYLRGFLGGLKHAVFTATAGAGFGYARETSSSTARVVVPLLGLTGAVVQHIAWNAVAARVITTALCGAVTPDGPCRFAPAPADLFFNVPLIVALFVGPGVVALFIIARRSRTPGAFAAEQG